MAGNGLYGMPSELFADAETALTNGAAALPPFGIGGQMKIRALDPREIQLVIKVGKGKHLAFPVESINLDFREELKAQHGTGSGVAYALVGGNIDIDGSFEVKSFVGSNQLESDQIDMLRRLLRKGPEGRAVYFRIDLFFLDYDSGDATDPNAYRIASVENCKLKNNGLSVSNGQVVSTKFDIQALRFTVA